MTSANAGLAKTLEYLKNVAISTNAEWAERLGIPTSAAITCVKPSGTVSQLVDSASGIHARHSPYYIRTVRGDNKDPLTQFLIDQGVPNEPCVMKGDTTTVFSFPQKAPAGAVTRNDMTAIEQLETWLTYQRHWCEHKPSITVSVRDHEWVSVGAFVYEHFDEMSGVSFLPHSDHTYQQAPYQDCGKSDYEELLSLMPTDIDWSKLTDYEKEDNTAGMQTMACSGDSCEIVDLT
jgi:ribonucleoside-diphosphate reductase alpha chain